MNYTKYPIKLKNYKWYSARYDRPFKDIFCGEDNKNKLEIFLSSLLRKKITIEGYLNNELQSSSVSERRKTVDLYVKMDDTYLILELNNGVKEYTPYRNFVFFSSTIAQKTRIGEEYDICINHLLINLTYGIADKDFVEDTYTFTSKETGIEYLNNIQVKEINMDKIMDFWYDKNIEKIWEYKYLIMLDLEPESLDELLNITKGDVFVSDFKEKICGLNTDKDYVNFLTAEEENEMFYRTDMSIARKEGHNKERKEIINKLISKGKTIEEVSDLLDISVEDIQNLIDM